MYVSGALTLPDVGGAAAQHAVYILAVMCTGPGFEDGEAEDLLNAVLSNLRDHRRDAYDLNLLNEYQLPKPLVYTCT